MTCVNKTIMNNKLVSAVRLPYIETRGSIETRQIKARQLVERLYENIHDKFENGKMPIEEIQKQVTSILPPQLNVIVQEGYDRHFNGAYSDIIFASNIKKIIGTTIELFSSDHKFNQKSLPILTHEFQHVADQIYHPKYLARVQHMQNSNYATEKYDRLYNDILYIPEFAESKKEKQLILKRIEHKLHKFLRRRTAEEKLDYIQDARYTLEMEHQAYLTQAKYVQKMKEAGIPVNTDDALDNYDEIFMFSEKIQLLKKIGFDIIQKERQKIAKKLENQKLRNVNIQQK